MCEALQTLHSSDSSLIFTASCGERRAGIVTPNGYMKKQSLTVQSKVTQPLGDMSESGSILSGPPPQHESLLFSASFMSLAP